MKKWLCHIFNIYLLVMACIPCTDIHAKEVLTKNISSISIDTHKNCPHETEDDNCSPFCICSCCGHTLTITPYIPIVLKVAPIIVPTQISYTSSNLICQEVYLHIWRPPCLIVLWFFYAAAKCLVSLCMNCIYTNFIQSIKQYFHVR